MLAAMGTVSFAQDTAYISRDKITALIFPSSIKIIGKIPNDLIPIEKGNGVIRLKSRNAVFSTSAITTQDEVTNQLYHITLKYSYGRAGKRIEIGRSSSVITVIKTPVSNYTIIGNELAAGKRKNVVDRKKTGGVKAWVDKLSLAENRIFFRVDLRNHSNLPYSIDFIRFYIRDLKTVSRMATHEQEIVPIYLTLKNHTTILNSKETAKIFAFRRFSLSDDQALNIEIYERNGNRHLYLQIKQKDLDDLKTINPVLQQPVNAIAANTL
jgi:hypothetical protein